MPEMKASGGSDMTHLMKAVDQELAAGRSKGDPTEQKLRVTLEDKELWGKFKELTNEMIVTKSGRRMFPVLRVGVSGLDPSAMYSLLVDFVLVDSHRWKYVNGDWVAGGKAEPPPHNAVYVHPDSPNFGAHWMKEPVGFSKVKLTNKMHGSGQIMLNSLHKYQPRIHVVKVGSRDEKKTIFTHSFPETQFVAVTAYQNEEITALKIKYNPFAKAFQDAKERPDNRDLGNMFDDDDNKRVPHWSSPWFLPSGGTTLVPGPAHAMQSSLAGLGAPHPCERFTLRDHRHTPYHHPFSRRSPTHAAYPHEMSAQLPMLNLADNWMSAGHGHAAAAANLLANTGTGHQSQYPSMWNLSPGSQSCAVSQYLRSTAAAYLPAPTEHSTSVPTSLAVTATSADVIAHAPAHTQTSYGALAQPSHTDTLASTLTSYHNSHRDSKPLSASWTLPQPTL